MLKVPLFAILKILGQIRENSLIWSTHCNTTIYNSYFKLSSAITGTTIESLSIVALSLMNDKTEDDLDKLREQADRIFRKYPFGRSLLKLSKSRLLTKQLYYTLLQDSILLLFPEFAK